VLIDCTRPLDAANPLRIRYDVHHPPVGLLFLATNVLRSPMGDRVELKILDATVDYGTFDELKETVTSFKPDIVGLRCLNWYTEQFHAILQFVKQLPHPPLTIGGGPYASAAPAFIIDKDPNLDLIVVGEGERGFLRIVEAVHAGRDLHSVAGVTYRKCGRIVENLPEPVSADLDTIGYPDWTLIDLDRYNEVIGQAPISRKTAPIFTSRGCPFRCTYCHKLFQKKARFRSPGNVVEELKLLYDLGVRDVSVIDDIFNLDAKRVGDIFNLIAKNNLKMRFYYPNGLRGDRMTKEIIDTMVQGGSVLFTYALETGSPRIQKMIKKHLDLDRFREMVAYTIEQQVMVDMFLMVGFPTETMEEAQATLDFVKSFDCICFAYLNVLNVFPGTELFEQLITDGQDRDRLFKQMYFGYSSNQDFDLIGPNKAMIDMIQMKFLTGFFLNKKRLEKALAIQRKYLTEDEILKKYRSFYPLIDSIDQLMTRLAR
jgi:radical SAM superfamily enzyme YgiQ (UPF0313 family)